MENKRFKKLPISAVMVIFNEEKVIERSLQSFTDMVDEIIIVHDGKCGDSSLEIAKKYTNQIFEFEHIGVAEPHRVFTYQKARNDWVMQIDADEYLSDQLRLNLEELISGDADAYDVAWSVFRKNEHHLWFRKRMLFRKSKFYFIGATQEHVKPLNKSVKIQRIKFPLLHEPTYDNFTFAIFNKKWKKWSKLQAEQLLEDFALIPKWNCNLKDWETHRRMRIEHPLVLGLLGTIAYHGIFSLKDFFVYRKMFFLRMAVLSSMYHFSLYYYLIKSKRTKKRKVFFS